MGYWLALMESIVSIVGNFYLIATVMLLFQCFFDAEMVWNTKKKRILLCLSVVDEIVCHIWDHPIVTILVILAYLFLFGYGCEKKAISCVGKEFLVLLYLISCFMMLSDIGAYFVIPEYSLSDSHEPYYSVITLLIFLPLYYYLSFRFWKQGIWIPLRKREKWLFLFYWFYISDFYLLILFMQEDQHFMEGILQIAFLVTMLIFSLGLPIYILQNRVSSYYKDRQDYQERIIQAELSYFQQYKEKQRETRQFYHDIRNHLLCLRMLLEKEKEGEVREYLDSLLANVSILSPEIVTGDEMLDCIISAKAALMKQEGILFSQDGMLDGGMHWKPIDLCAVFANALDNAIEACKKIPQGQERNILLTIRKTERYYCIDIMNTVSEDVDCVKLLEGSASLTSKSNRHLHGFGIQNMKQTIEKYGGFLQMDYQDHRVTVSLLVPRSFTTGE